VEFGRRTVPVRVSTYDLGFWGKVLTYPDWDVTGRSYSGRPISYKRSMQRASMLEPNTAVGSGEWTQDGRPVACAVYSTSNVVVGVPDINLFALPLFVNVRELAAA
jgi:D-alanyl-D-alanine carboxypeptidase (penicillin-binding protein 5/6)